MPIFSTLFKIVDGRLSRRTNDLLVRAYQRYTTVQRAPVNAAYLFFVSDVTLGEAAPRRGRAAYASLHMFPAHTPTLMQQKIRLCLR